MTEKQEGMKVVLTLPPGTTIVGMTQFLGDVYLATTDGVFRSINGEPFIRMSFILNERLTDFSVHEYDE